MSSLSSLRLLFSYEIFTNQDRYQKIVKVLDPTADESVNIL
jgi:hypothetical protein